MKAKTIQRGYQVQCYADQARAREVEAYFRAHRASLVRTEFPPGQLGQNWNSRTFEWFVSRLKATDLILVLKPHHDFAAAIRCVGMAQKAGLRVRCQGNEPDVWWKPQDIGIEEALAQNVAQELGLPRMLASVGTMHDEYWKDRTVEAYATQVETYAHLGAPACLTSNIYPAKEAATKAEAIESIRNACLAAKSAAYLLEATWGVTECNKNGFPGEFVTLDEVVKIIAGYQPDFMVQFTLGGGGRTEILPATA